MGRLASKLEKIIFALSSILALVSADNVQHLMDVINDGIAQAAEYKLPVNANMYKPNNIHEKPREYGTFDFVIVGGGVTGSVLASRLSEIKGWSVLVLEAGKFVHNEFLQFMPYSYNYIHSEYNWGYKSKPQKTACLGTTNHQCWAHRGKGMGWFISTELSRISAWSIRRFQQMGKQTRRSFLVLPPSLTVVQRV
ncbi:hypothetical protein JTB14_025750 [Gonioctena quinquepunctata]|nr:hypothetical protein JTB14_025750 [Gonioctena quinquepunctata]